MAGTLHYLSEPDAFSSRPAEGSVSRLLSILSLSAILAAAEARGCEGRLGCRHE
jgi:hypothetical protein